MGSMGLGKESGLGREALRGQYAASSSGTVWQMYLPSTLKALETSRPVDHYGHAHVSGLTDRALDQ